MSEDNVKPALEALLFASEKPLTLEQAKEVLGLGTDEIRAKLEELKNEFEQSNRGLRIAEVAGGFRMITSSLCAPFIKKLYKVRRVERLSRQALETLAIIAYKQPVTKLDIESLRNVANIDGVISSLLDKNLIRIAGRKKAAGRPFVFGTTRQFLEYFGLNSLEELPKMEDFSKMAQVQAPEEKKEEPLSEVTDGAEEPAQAD